MEREVLWGKQKYYVNLHMIKIWTILPFHLPNRAVTSKFSVLNLEFYTQQHFNQVNAYNRQVQMCQILTHLPSVLPFFVNVLIKKGQGVRRVHKIKETNIKDKLWKYKKYSEKFSRIKAIQQTKIAAG